MAYSKQDIENIFKEIIFDIENGSSLRASLLKDNRPDSTTFYKWIDNEDAKSIQYARAMEKRAEVIFEDILNIADDSSGDKKFTENGETIDSEFVARSRIRIDARKWMLGKMQPKKYSDRTILAGDKDNPIEITPNAIRVTIVEPLKEDE
jgi:hypothetical protein